MASEQEILKALEIQRQLRSIFESGAGGSNDRGTVGRVRALCEEAFRAVDDLHCRDSLAQIENYADALFSNRKHQQWARRSASGVLVLRHRAYAALDSVERRLHYLQAACRPKTLTGTSARSLESAFPQE
jgi:hypothetical protein